VDDVDVLRALYRYLRRHPSMLMRGRAYRLWQRWSEGNAASFIAAPNGDVVALPSRRAALIAEYRILLLRAGYPVDWVARFDRTDV
jgi:hypothetical protein